MNGVAPGSPARVHPGCAEGDAPLSAGEAQGGPPLARQPRAEGEARISARPPLATGGRMPGQCRLGQLYMRGSSKILLPREPGPALPAVLLNTAGGITGGDRFSIAAEAEPGARLTIATQAAERLYRAQPHETGRMDTRLAIGPGARLDWLPQETIVFDRAALDRSLAIDMAEDGVFLGVESFVFGRRAMGETVTSARIRDSWRLRRGGRLVYADALRLGGAVSDILARPGAAGGAVALASIVYAAPLAGDRLDTLRDRLDPLAAAGVQAGASCRDGVLVCRIVAPDGLALRGAMADTLTCLLDGPLPRVWRL